MENYYELFNLSNYSSVDKIKFQYQQIIKQCHPDKALFTKSLSIKESSETFLKVTEAWNILRNPDTKAEYDAKLKQFETEIQFSVNEVVTIDQFESIRTSDVTEKIDGDLLEYDCCCGGKYEFLKKDSYINTSILIGCSNCSLYIEVLLKK